MATQIFEWYGYAADDRSAAAGAARNSKHCPFLQARCTKPNGVCSLEYAEEQRVAVCPNRMYFEEHLMLRRIADSCFSSLDPLREGDGLVTLFRGDQVKEKATSEREHVVGVFGKGLGGEIRLPTTTGGGAGYSIDFVMVAVSPTGEPVGIVPIEVQTIDTTGSYGAAIATLEATGNVVATGAGMNWENVNKRILPQLITKGLMLQAERLCRNGLFFLTPQPVYDRIMLRLGGPARLREIPRQPSSITFVRAAYGTDFTDGTPVPLIPQPWRTVSTSDLSLAFITPENLPPAGSYEARVRAKL
jgi:hypothetical protein